MSIDLPWLEPLSPAASRLFLIACALAGYVLLMLTNPARASLRDGARCLGRHRAMWFIFAVLGIGYALFRLGLRVFFHYALPPDAAPEFLWSRAWFLPDAAIAEALRDSILPAAESVAALFNCSTTFPVSALAALLFLGNWEGHFAVLRRALCKRFPRTGWLLIAGLVLSAIAAIAKPLAYAALPFFGMTDAGPALALASQVIDWLSFIFEYMLGIGIQIYLILLAYVWMRGLTHTHEHLIDFAIRRFAFVVRWAGVVILLSTFFIHLPLILASAAPTAGWLPPPSVLDFVHRVARPLLAVVLLLFATTQITLVFHSERLRHALRDHCRFVLRHAWRLGWFLVIAALHFYALQFGKNLVLSGAGGDTAIGIMTSLVSAILAALLAGWLLASWVSLYRRCEAGRAAAADWIKF